MNENELITLICYTRNAISLICFTILAIVFQKWWIVFFSLIFWAIVVEEKGEQS